MKIYKLTEKKSNSPASEDLAALLIFYVLHRRLQQHQNKPLIKREEMYMFMLFLEENRTIRTMNHKF